jgi:hypothetical protein
MATDRPEEPLQLAKIVAVLERSRRRWGRGGNRASGGGLIDDRLRAHPHRGRGEERRAGRLHGDEDGRAAVRDGLSVREKLAPSREELEGEPRVTHQAALQETGKPLEQSSAASSQHSSMTPAIQPLCMAIMSVHGGAVWPCTAVAKRRASPRRREVMGGDVSGQAQVDRATAAVRRLGGAGFSLRGTRLCGGRVLVR